MKIQSNTPTPIQKNPAFPRADKNTIIEEALVQNVDDFVRFMEVAAIMDGEILNYENVASDCEVSANTVKAYYKILVDTLLGFEVPSGRVIETCSSILVVISVIGMEAYC